MEVVSNNFLRMTVDLDVRERSLIFGMSLSYVAGAIWYVYFAA